MVTVVSTIPHQSVVKEKICNNCGSTLQYVPNDTMERKTVDYTGSSDISHYIQCPVCTQYICEAILK